jgi:parvulin-like peptidyl-prolyl isomerase
MGMSILSIRRYAKRLLAPVIIVLVVAMMVGVFYIGFPSASRENIAYRGPSIKVNGQKLSDADFNNYLMQASQQASQFAQYGMTYSDAQIRDTAINMAVQNIAFNQEMQKVKSKIKVSNSEVDSLIKKYLPTEEELQSFMERQGFTSKNEFKKAVRQDLERQKFIQYKANQLKITVPRAEIVGQLDQIKVSHILIGLQGSDNKTRTDAQALQLANEVYQKVTGGGDFAQLAKQYSDDPGSKDNGGAYSAMPVEQFKASMVKEFVDGALVLKKDQISKPVKTQYGYHIIKLDSRGLPTGSEYKEQYNQVRNSLLLQKAQQSPAYSDWVEKINRKAQNNLEIIDPGLRAYRLQTQQKWVEAAQAYEKALKKAYYKVRIETYTDASSVYVQLKQPKEAIAILKKAPAASTDTIDYQVALANAYKADNKKAKAQATLVKFSQAHPDDVSIHTRLKDIYTSWDLTDLAAKETQTIADIQKQEQAKLQQYQDSLKQNGSEQTSPAASQAAPVQQ